MAVDIVSFFVYSIFLNSIVAYLVSPLRGFNRNKRAGRLPGMILALLLFMLLAGGEVLLENGQQGPNYYQSLRATRNTPPAELKKLYKKRMRETHPDKTKSNDTEEEFRRAKQAYDVLSNRELRDIYDRLGEEGLEVYANQNAEEDKIDMATVRGIDMADVVLKIMVTSVSYVLLVLVMTMAEPSGEAFAHSLLVLAIITLLEFVFVVGGHSLPPWLLPSWPAHDIVSKLKSLFPAMSNAIRCMCSALFQFDDPFIHQAEVLERVVASSVNTTNAAIAAGGAWKDSPVAIAEDGEKVPSRGSAVEEAITRLQHRIAASRTSPSQVQTTANALLQLGKASAAKALPTPKPPTGFDSFFSLPYLIVYLLLQGAYIAYKKNI